MVRGAALVVLFGLPLLLASRPAPFAGEIVVPEGLVAEPYLSVPLPVSLRRDPAGRLLVGAWRQVLREETPGAWTQRAAGPFLATAVDAAPDGTLYIGDSEWTFAFGVGVVWALPPGAAALERVCFGPGYWQGVAVLPGGDLLAVNEGFIGPNTHQDGALHRLPPSARDVDLFLQPSLLANKLRNPVSAEIGPDGSIYFLDRGFLGLEPGSLYRFTLGEGAAQEVLGGLNDPYDTAWLPDGSLLITDVAEGKGVILRYVPSTGTVEPWAGGFGSTLGIDTAPNGDVYVCDASVDTVYRIRPRSIGVPMSLEPETINLKSSGNTVLARIESGPGLASGVRIVSVDGASIDPIPALDVRRAGKGVHATFSRDALQAVLSAGERRVRVEGVLENGAPFHAEDGVRAIH